MPKPKNPNLPVITRNDEGTAVVLPVEEFNRLVVRSRQPKSLVEFFQESPLVGLELDFARDKEVSRDTNS